MAISSILGVFFAAILCISLGESPGTSHETENTPAQTTAFFGDNAETLFTDETQDASSEQIITTTDPIINPSQQASEQTPATTGTGENDPSSWSRQQIIENLTNAVNKTKAFTGSVAVQHSESFDAKVIECTGGSMVAGVVESLIGMVVKPSESVLAFNAGTAANSEGETIPLLLPESGMFSLPADGVVSASASKSGNDIKITVQLVSESCGLYDKPKNNAAAIGFLDVGGLDISFLEITDANILYSGSSISVVINNQGMVTEAIYTIPLRIEGSAKVSFISGSAVFEGSQIETWNFQW